MENTIGDILRIAKKYGLLLAKDTIEFVNIGLDFQVAFGIDDGGKTWVLRIPRRKDAFLKTKQEKETLDMLNKLNLPFAVPNWEIYSDELIGYPILRGDIAVETNAETQETNWKFSVNDVPEQFTESLGKSLAALHSLFGKNDFGQQLTKNDIREDMRRRMEAVKKSYEIDEGLWLRWQRWLDNEELWPNQAGFIHGDLYPGHMLLNENFSVIGIIDWTEAKLADPSNDFTAHYMLFGEEELGKLLSAYQAAGGYTWPKMKEHIIQLLSTQAITLAEFGESSGLDEYKQIAKDMLKNSNE